MASTLTVTAQDIIEDALLEAGIVPAEQSIPAFEQEKARKKLNYFLKSLQAQGHHLWTKTEGIVFLDKGTQKYKLGANSDHSCLESDFINTTSTAAAASAATTLTVSTTGMTGAADILADPTNSTQDWTLSGATIATSGGALTLTNSGAAAGTASFTLNCTVGEKYIVNFSYTKGTSVGAKFEILDDTAVTVLDSITLTATDTTNQLEFTATQLTHTFKATNSSAVSGETFIWEDMTQKDTNSGDFIGIELDGGTRQWTNIVTVDSATQVTLNDALTGAAASGNTVFSYTTKMVRPQRVIDARSVRQPSTTEIPLFVLNRQEYFELSDKAQENTVNNFYYSPQLTDGELYVWPTSDAVKQYLRVTFVRPIDITVNNDDAVDIPAEWALALTWNLASLMLPGFKTDPQRQQILDQMAGIYLEEAIGYDHEYASMYVGFDNARY